LYDRDYFRRPEGGAGVGYGHDYLGDPARRDRLAYAESLLETLAGGWRTAGARCLEAGCATGEFCATLERHGATAIGIDISEAAIREARQRYPRLDFRAGPSEALDAYGEFDAVFAFELIEHLPSPRRFLGAAHAALRPGGRLVVSTPNLACGRRVGYPRWIGFHTSFEHLYFFSPDTLGDLARRAGFRCERWFTGFGDGALPPAAVTARDRVRSGLARLGLLGVARRMKRSLARREPRPIYSEGGEEHTLLAVLRKVDQPV
jgi:SAM-dependent methyltransferase